MIYLDNAATTAPSQSVLKAVQASLTNFYNPSAIYPPARLVKLAIEKARCQVAQAINADPSQIFFTSGATESNNIVRRAFNYMICSNIEHPSIKGIEFNIFSDNWQSSLTSIIEALTQEKPKDKSIVSLQWVNNETGKILPVKEACKLAHSLGLPFHTDATQAFSHIPIDVKDLDCDFLSLSAHKWHGLKGVGVLYIKEPDKFKSDIVGGSQEKGIRPGTENVIGIISAGVAAERHNFNVDEYKYATTLFTHLTTRLRNEMPKEYISNHSYNFKEYIPYIFNFSIKGVEGESLLLLLGNRGICVSAGSACHSGELGKSKVIAAMGVPDDYAYGTIRVSMSDETDISHIDVFCDALFEILRVL